MSTCIDCDAELDASCPAPLCWACAIAEDPELYECGVCSEIACKCGPAPSL